MWAYLKKESGSRERSLDTMVSIFILFEVKVCKGDVCVSGVKTVDVRRRLHLCSIKRDAPACVQSSGVNFLCNANLAP